MDFFIKNKFGIAASLFIILAAVYFFDKSLSIGLFLILILSAATFFVLNKFGFKDKRIYLLFMIVLAIHLGATLFMHYANFQPFSGGNGDYVVYQKSAVEISQSFRQGNFSLNNIASKYPDIFLEHYYPVILGTVYALTLPQEIIGLMMNVWLVALSIIFIYLIVLEIGGSPKGALAVGIMAALYPSYIFNSGLLLKEAIEICFIFLAMLFLIRTIKKFTWPDFIVLYLALIAATHFRFYVGYAIIATFILFWFLFSRINIKKRMIYGIIFIVALGFIPLIAANQGYYGFNSFKNYLNLQSLSFYRQVANLGHQANPGTTISNSTPESSNYAPGFDSSFVGGSTPMGYAKSFIYVLLGPFPWQIKSLKQAFALAETIPWYFILFLAIRGIIKIIKKDKVALSLAFFSIMVMCVASLFLNNFGILVRIRMPAFLALICFVPFGIYEKEKILANKIFGRIADVPLIILKLKNWPSLLSNYFGVRKGKFEYYLRNGLVIKAVDFTGAAAIVSIFIKGEYGKVDDNYITIDIGANIGAYSIFAAEAKNTIVYAYEPEANNFRFLEDNIKSNNLKKSILPFNLAVCAKKGKRVLFLGTSFSHSIYKINNPTGKNIECPHVDCVSLQDIFQSNGINNCDILKLDCEGAEFEILYNFPEEFFKKIKNIRMEYHNHKNKKSYNGEKLAEFLVGKGFKIEKFERTSQSQGDLWLKKC